MDPSTGSGQAPSTGSGQGQDQEPGDAAAEAFEGVRAEVALLRRAVERLAAERADKEVVDYSETLARMSNNLTATAQRVDTLAKNSGQGIVPSQIANQIVMTASDARRNDQQIIAEARAGLDQATRQITGMVVSARRGDEQNRWLAGTAAGGLIIGMALWAALAGPIARAVPESWLWPERMAARTLDRPMWEAGQRMMATAGPTAFRSIVAGDKIVTANRTVIDACAKAAKRAGEVVRCTIRVSADADRAP